MMKKLCFLFVFVAMAVSAFADVPKTINYQGRLTDINGNSVTDGAYNIVVSLYTAETGGTLLWDENLSVQTKNGYFNTILGAVETFESRGVDFDSQYYLGIKVGLDNEMTPRQPLNGVPYAMNIANGAITTDKIADNAVTKIYQFYQDEYTHTQDETITIFNEDISIEHDGVVKISAKGFISNGAANYALATWEIFINDAWADISSIRGTETNDINTGFVMAITGGLEGSVVNVKLRLTVDHYGADFVTGKHRMIVEVFYK